MERAYPFFMEKRADFFAPSQVGAFGYPPPPKRATPSALCGLEVCGSLADTKGGEHKVRIRFKDPRGRTHYGNLSRGDLVARDSQAVLKELCDNGLQLGGRKVGAYLTEYLYMAPLGFLPRYEGSNALGWVETEESGWAFVESDKTLGASGKNAEESHIIYTGRTGRAPNLSKRGTLDDWKRELAA